MHNRRRLSGVFGCFVIFALALSAQLHASQYTVTAPNGGETLTPGTVFTIKWTSTTLNTGYVNLELWNGTQNYVSFIAYQTQNNGSYDWTVDFAPVGANYTVKVTDVTNSAFSANPFTITYGIVFTRPSPSFSYEFGSGAPQTVRWTANVPGNVSIEVYDAADTTLVQTIAASTNHAAYEYTFNNTLATGSYKMRITALDTTPMAVGKAAFTVAPKAVSVVNPNGGEVFFRGIDTIFITWKINVEDHTKIELVGAQTFTIFSNYGGTSSNNVTYVYNFPASIPKDNNYKLRITSLNDAAITGSSATVFAVTDPSVTVTQPNGGETLVRGTSTSVQWDSNIFSGTAKIELVKGGVLQTPPLATGVSYYVNSGYLNVTIPITQAAGSDYTMRVTDESHGPSSADESNAPFTIAPQTFTVTAPNGGEQWRLGTQQSITWTNGFGTNTTCKLDLYKAGVFLRSIASGLTTNNHFYNWTLPGDIPVASDYTVRITGTSDSGAFDDSNLPFSTLPQMTILLPNGGENWPVGTTQHISWASAADASKNVKLELFDSSNTLVLTITTSAPDNGGFDWAIPVALQSNSYKIRITRLDDATLTDDSNNFFSIGPKALYLNTPQGSSHIPRTLDYHITWYSNLGGNCKIELLKGGVFNATLAASVANPINDNTGDFAWTVTQAVGADYRVRITSLSDATQVTTSNSNFAIEDPAITVTAPALNSQIVAGNHSTVTWNTNFTSNVNVILVKGGTDIATLSTSQLNSGTFNWSIPFTQTLGADYAIRVTTTDNSITNTSPLFSIIAMTLTVRSPNGGEHYSIGTNQYVQLNTNADFNNLANIDLLKGGVVVQNLYTGVTLNNNISYLWSIPLNQTLGSDYRVRATHAARPALTADSAADFSIVPRMQVLTPAFVIVYPGTAQSITWNSGVGGNVTIELLLGGAHQTLFASTPNNGSVVWNIPANITLGTYQVKITSLTDNTITDTGAGFQIQAKSISVNTPSGGDLGRGYNSPIQWYSNFNGNVKIELVQVDAQNAETVVQTISASTANYSPRVDFAGWIIPANLPTGPNFKIKISHLTDPVIAYSSSPFSISAPRITVTAPNGGEQIPHGTTTYIGWTSNFGGDVKIDLLEGANAPQSISASTPNNGSFGWSVPLALNANDFKIRINTLDDSVSASSSAVFSIIAHHITLTKPSGGEKISVGTNLSMTWTSNFVNAGNVKIELLKAGSVNTVIASSVGNGNGYSFQVPLNQMLGTDYRVRVTSELDPTGTDTTAADFEIRANQPPVANAGPDQTVKEMRIGFSTVSLSGSASTDDGSIAPLTYKWNEGATLVGTGSDIKIELSLGDHTLTLTVFDGQLSASANVVVHVLANAPPVANAGSDQTVIQTLTNGANVTLSGSGSTDDGSIAPLTYAWTEGPAALSTQPTFTQVYSVGTHAITLTVFDGQYHASANVNVTVQPVPNLIVDSVIVPPDAYTGQAFEVTWVDKNIGGGKATGPWADHLYLSLNGQIGNAIDLGFFVFGGSLAAGESVSRTQTVSVANSPSFSDAKYSVIVVVDGMSSQNSNVVFEGPYENDNVTLSPQFNVHPLPLPDLIVESVIVPATAFSGQSVTVQYVVKNQGPGSTDLPLWNDRIYLSVDSLPDTGDLIQALVPNVSALAPGERYTGSYTFTIPIQTAGPFHVIVKANDDSFHTLLETTTANNFNLANMQINVPQTADLQVTQFGSDDNGFSGMPINVNWTVQNTGPVAAIPVHGAITDTVYLSQDAVLNTVTAKNLGSFSHAGNLNPGEGYAQQNRTVTLPKAISGTWNLFVFTDSTNEVFEYIGESNNVVSRPISIVRSPDPDLIVQSVMPPATGFGGHEVTIAWTTKNQGAADVTRTFADAVYVSTDAVLSNDDIVLGTSVQQPLPGGQSVTKSQTFKLPQELSGSYYVIVKTDYAMSSPTGVVYEFDPNFDAEANNVTSSVTTMQVTWVPPDLQVTAVAAPAAAFATQDIAVSWTVINGGPGDTTLADWDDSIYLSSVSPLDLTAPGTRRLGVTHHTGLLNPNETYSASQIVNLPPDVAAGNYFIFVRTDIYNAVQETGHEDNNDGHTALLVAIASTPPDLVVDSITVPATIGTGQKLNFSWIVRNAGTGPTLPDSGWVDQVYLSTDQSLNAPGTPPDISLIPNEGFGQGGVLAVNGTYNGSGSYKLGYDLAPGTYYLIVVTNMNNSVFEGPGAANNVKVSAPFTITATPAPDLVVTAVSALPATAQSGQFVDVIYTVTNSGTGPTDADTIDWSDTIYLSRDLVLDPTDVALGTGSRSGALAAGASYTNTVTVELPRNIAGPYNLFIKTNSTGAVYELDATNNIGHGPLPITLAPPADLTVTAAYPPIVSTVLIGDSANFSYTVKNIGLNKAAGQWTDNLYLSSDTTWDFKDLLLGSVKQNRTLLPGDSYDGSLTVNLPAILPGHYYLIVRTDIRNNIRESDETNNTGVSANTMVADVPELTLGVGQSAALSQGAAIYYKVKAPDQADILITLDSTSTDDYNDLFAAQAFVPTTGEYQFSHDDPYRASQKILIPSATAGFYYILVHGNRVTEVNAPFTITAKVLDFSIVDVIPNKGGNGGRITPQIRGAKFTSLTTATLVQGAVQRSASKVYFFDTTRIYATFDLKGLSAGTYDVVLNDLANSASLPNGFTVIDAPATGQAPVQAAIFSPAALRLGTKSVLTLGYTNATNNDLDAPLFQPSSDYSKLRLSADEAYDQNGDQIIGINFSGPAGVLPPGARQGISYQFIDAKHVGISLHTAPEFTTASKAAMDFSALERQMRPATATDAKWNPMWQHFVTKCGGTFGGFIAVMDDAATSASRREQYLYRLGDLFPYALVDNYKEVFYNVTGNAFINDRAHPLPPNIMVILNDSVQLKTAATKTDSDGSFRLYQVPPGTYTVSVNGYSVDSPGQVIIGNLPVTDLNIICKNGGAISGRVTDENNLPLAGIGVVASDASNVPNLAISKADGTYTISGVAAGTYSVQAGFVSNVAPHTISGVVLQSNMDKKQGIDFKLYGQLVLNGTVKALAGNAPIAGAVVIASSNGVSVSSSTTVSDGSYQFAELEPGSYSLNINASGYVPATASVTITAKTISPSVQTLLKTGAAITVAVTNSAGGASVVNAMIKATSGGTPIRIRMTDANGRVVVNGLDAGTYGIDVLFPGLGQNHTDVTVSVGQQITVPIILNPTGTVSGIVTAPNASPLKAAKVAAVANDANNTVYAALTDASGAYTIRDLPNGSYALILQTTEVSGISRFDFTISANSLQQSHNFIVNGGTIRGSVFKSDGTTAITQGAISITSVGRAIVQAPLNSDGSFCFYAVADGSYTLEIQCLGFIFAPINVTIAGAQTVTGVNILAGASAVQGTLSNAAHIPVANAYVALLSTDATRAIRTLATAFTDSNGAYTFTAVPSGNFNILARADGLAQQTIAVNVPVNGSVNGDMTLLAQKPLTINVTHGNQLPVGGAVVAVFAAGSNSSLDAKTSDADGACAISGLSAGNYDVLIQADGYEYGLVLNYDHTGAGTVTTVQLGSNPLTVSGQVKASDGQGINGAMIVALNSQGRPLESTRSDFSGNYQMMSLQSGIYTLHFQADGFNQISVANVSVASNVSGQNASLSAIAIPDEGVAGIFSTLDVQKTVDAQRKIDDLYETVVRRPDDPLKILIRQSDCKFGDEWYLLLQYFFSMKEHAYYDWEKQRDVANQVIGVDMEGSAIQTAIFGTNAGGVGLAKLGVKVFVLAGVDVTRFIITGNLVSQQLQNSTGDAVHFDDFDSWVSSWNTISGTASSMKSGIEYANKIEATGASANVNGFLGWLGAVTQAYGAFNALNQQHNDVDDARSALKFSRERYFARLDKFNEIARQYLNVTTSCNGQGIRPAPQYAFTFAAHLGSNDGGNGSGGNAGGGSGFTRWLKASDPNEKRGPDGFGPNHAIPAGQTMTYTVFCENHSDATAPVQKLDIEDQLDPNLDLRTFRIKEVVLGTTTIAIPDNKSIYSGRTQLGADQGSIFIDVFAGVDVFTGRSFLTASAIDPATGQRPLLPQLGFMPPNDAMHSGEGHIVYSIAPKANLLSGTKIVNMAAIRFDVNEVINTNTVTNTIDGEPPVSGVDPLAALTEGTTVNVSWSGTDAPGGSGLKNFDIYVSDNGGAFTIWQTAAALTSAPYTGVVGHTYGFYSIAHDYAGNVEATPAVADASTTLVTHINRAPTTSGIADVSLVKGAAPKPVNLLASFDDFEDGAAGLTYTVSGNTNPALFATAAIGSDGVLTLANSGLDGSSTLTVHAVDSGGLSVDASFKVSVSTPPAITSKLADSATAGAPYTYTIAATGTAPINFKATSLPDGLKFLGSVISGTPTAAGVSSIALSASNGTSPDDAKTLVLTIAAAVPATLTFASAPSATPNPATVGQKVTFTANAASASAVTYTWSYGDGTADVGASVSHPFSPAKTYTATVVATNADNISGSATVSVVVNAATGGGPGSGPGTLPGELDSDGDGFSDAVEIAAGSDPFDPNSIPGGKGALVKGVVTNPVLKMNAKKKSLTLTGSLHIPKGFVPKGQILVSDIGGFIQKFQLDSKGGGKTDKDTFKAGIKIKKGTVSEQNATFKLVLNAVPDTVKSDSPLLIVIGGTVFVKGP